MNGLTHVMLKLQSINAKDVVANKLSLPQELLRMKVYLYQDYQVQVVNEKNDRCDSSTAFEMHTLKNIVITYLVINFILISFFVYSLFLFSVINSHYNICIISFYFINFILQMLFSESI